MRRVWCKHLYKIIKGEPNHSRQGLSNDMLVLSSASQSTIIFKRTHHCNIKAGALVYTIKLYFFFKGNIYIAGGLKKKRWRIIPNITLNPSHPQQQLRGVCARRAHAETHAELSSLTPFRSDLPPHLAALGFDLAFFLPTEAQAGLEFAILLPQPLEC